jgi:hypothetical protein
MLVQAGQVKSAAPMQHGLSGDSVRVTEGSGHLSRIHQANAAMPSEVLLAGFTGPRTGAFIAA